jgi:hypothetical protein
VSLNEWILALHVLSAFALVAAIVLFWILVVAVRRTDLAFPPPSRGGTVGMSGSLRAGTLGGAVSDEHRRCLAADENRLALMADRKDVHIRRVARRVAGSRKPDDGRQR